PDPLVEDTRERILIPGDLPSPANPPAGCRFHTRCPYVQPRCVSERPMLRQLEPAHIVACHFAEDIRDGRLQMSASAHDPRAVAMDDTEDSPWAESRIADEPGDPPHGGGLPGIDASGLPPPAP